MNVVDVAVQRPGNLGDYPRTESPDRKTSVTTHENLGDYPRTESPDRKTSVITHTFSQLHHRRRGKRRYRVKYSPDTHIYFEEAVFPAGVTVGSYRARRKTSPDTHTSTS